MSKVVLQKLDELLELIAGSAPQRPQPKAAPKDLAPPEKAKVRIQIEDKDDGEPGLWDFLWADSDDDS